MDNIFKKIGKYLQYFQRLITVVDSSTKQNPA